MTRPSHQPSSQPCHQPSHQPRYQPWDLAWQLALYGPDGFYRSPEGPAGHFRTATHAAADLLTGALARLATRAGCTAVLDIGAGRGELLTALAGCPGADHLRLHGVDVVPRPPALPVRIGWTAGLDALPGEAIDGALVIGWELLDVVPCPILQVDSAGRPRAVHVEVASGTQLLAGPPAAPDAAWCATWWPLDGAAPGSRAEVGRGRDELWAHLVGLALRSEAGAVLLGVDYAHTRDARPLEGSLTGYRLGRQVLPVPDGSCDVTADVAIDAVARAGEVAGATGTVLTTQRQALMGLGVSGKVSPGDGLEALVRASRAAELLDPHGLGGFSWVLQGAGRPLEDPRFAPDQGEQDR